MESATSETRSTSRPNTVWLAFQRLKLIGFLGATHGLHEEARVIGAAVELLVPDPLAYNINLILAQAMGGGASHAVEAMQARLGENPDDDRLKVAMGVAMLVAGHDDWKFPLDNVLALSLDQRARKGALAVIDRESRLGRLRSA